MDHAGQYQFAADLMKSGRAFFFGAGSTALCALLRAMRLEPGDEVLVQGFTCTSVPYAVLESSALPVYVDIDPITFNLDPALVEEKITPRTRVLIIQHTFGVPAEMDALMEIARRRKLWVIEDACHSFGSRYKGREVGTFGDAAIYSFGWHKPITLGRGGAAVINNPELQERMRQRYQAYAAPRARVLLEQNIKFLAYRLFYSPSRFWGMKEMYRRLRDFATGPRKGSLEALLRGQSVQAVSLDSAGLESVYQHELETSQARAQKSEQAGQAQGTRMLPFEIRRLAGMLAGWGKAAAHCQRMAVVYRQSLEQAGFTVSALDPALEPVYYKFPLLVAPDAKRKILAQAVAAGVEMSDMFGSPLTPLERALQWKVLGYRPGMCPVTEQVSAGMIALPVHARVQAAQVRQAVALLSAFKG